MEGNGNLEITHPGKYPADNLRIPASDWLNRQNEYDSALLDYEEKNNISSEKLAILKPLKDIFRAYASISTVAQISK